jgi:serine/threonine-protein kinase
LPAIPRPNSRPDSAPESDPPPPGEVRSTQTRRLGSNAQVLLELGLDETIPADLPLSATPPPVRPAVAEDPQLLDSVDILLDDVVGPPAPARSIAAAELAPQASFVIRPPLTDEPAPAPAVYVPGDVIDGKYRLTRIIGRGGMGAVWLAHNLPLDMAVAVKLIRRDRTAPEAAGRLLQEARAAARLKHPSIVRVFDFGESEQGDPFIVMELLNGESFAAILRRKKRLSPAIAVQTLLPVASALASAHGKGIVHRDLKPDNVLLITDESGALVPKVVDFGIAKLLSNDPDRPFTLAGEVLGSPDYMSPEQARGADNVGEATDVWAFSVVLYEAVAGRRPFDGPNYNSLIAAILTNDPPPIPGLGDSALWAILERGLTKNIKLRWASMRDLGAALAQWAVDQGIEEDVCGNRIAKQWLSGAMRRIFTVYPEQDEPAGQGVRPAAGASATDSVLSTDAAARAGGRSGAGSPVDTRSSRRARRPGTAFWFGLVTPVVIALFVLGYLARGSVHKPVEGAGVTLTASSVPAATGELAPVASAAPATRASIDAAPSASAAPTTTASARGAKPLKPPPVVHKKAPSVPKTITF